jgi:hypothetical protein
VTGVREEEKSKDNAETRRAQRFAEKRAGLKDQRYIWEGRAESGERLWE